jgi:hypothetical protein
MKGLFILKIQDYRKLEMKFILRWPLIYYYFFKKILFIKVFSQLLFLFSKKYKKWEEYLFGIIINFENYGNTFQGL